MQTTLSTLSTEIIQQIDERLKGDEYKNFKATANALIEIKGKLIHKMELSKNQIATLKAEKFLLY